jgi:hypothetical protein
MIVVFPHRIRDIVLKQWAYVLCGENILLLS